MPTLTFPNRGAANPDKRTGGREEILQNLRDLIAALAVGSATADSFFDYSGNNSAANITLTDLAQVMEYYFTTSGRSLILPDCTAAATAFDGGIYYLKSPKTASYGYTVKDDGGNILCTVNPGEAVLLKLKDASTASGTWGVEKNVHWATVGIQIGDGSKVPSAGVKGDIYFPYNARIMGYVAVADQAGSAQVDVWKDAYANFPPTDADTITASAPIVISATEKATDTTLTGWTRDVTAGEFIRFNLDSITDIKRLMIFMLIVRTD